jgi:hypothetical protein
MEIFTKNSAKCTIFQSTNCNNFSSLMFCFLRLHFLVSPFPNSCESQKLGIPIFPILSCHKNWDNDFSELQKLGKLGFPILVSIPHQESWSQFLRVSIIGNSNFCDCFSGGCQMSPFFLANGREIARPRDHKPQKCLQTVKHHHASKVIMVMVHQHRRWQKQEDKRQWSSLPAAMHLNALPEH